MPAVTADTERAAMRAWWARKRLGRWAKWVLVVVAKVVAVGVRSLRTHMVPQNNKMEVICVFWKNLLMMSNFPIHLALGDWSIGGFALYFHRLSQQMLIFLTTLENSL